MSKTIIPFKITLVGHYDLTDDRQHPVAEMDQLTTQLETVVKLLFAATYPHVSFQLTEVKLFLM